jgi:hypothetical protein
MSMELPSGVWIVHFHDPVTSMAVESPAIASCASQNASIAIVARQTDLVRMPSSIR